MKPVHASLHLLFLLLAAAPGVAPTTGVIADKADAKVGAKNRAIIEDGLLSAGTVTLPAGLIHLDRALMLGPQHSGGTLQGTGPLTILRNSFSAGTGENGTLQVGGLGVNYYQSATVSDDGNAYILDPTVPGTPLPWDHPSNQPELLKPGCVVYLYGFNSYWNQTPPPRKRALFISLDRATRRLVLDVPPVPGLTALKWMSGHPIADVAEGSRTVRPLFVGHVSDYPAGRAVFVTSGPSVANEAVGEHRRVLASDFTSGMVTLDRPVTRGYTDATLALVSPVADLTVSRLTLAQPAHPDANPSFVKFATGLTFSGVYSTDPISAGCGFVNCGNLVLKDCEFNGVGLNVGHDQLFDGGTATQVYGDECSTTTTIRNVTVRANPKRPGNGIQWYLGSDRLTLSRVRVEGFGLPIPGSGSSVGINAGGRGLSLTDVTFSAAGGVGAGYLRGDGATLRRVVADSGVTIEAGRGWWISDSSAPGWDIRSGTSGAASGTPNVPATPGWKISP